MNKDKLIILFNLIKKYGYRVRESRLNGLEAWQPVKKLLDDKKELINGWNINVNINGHFENDLSKIFNYVHDELKMYGDDNEENYKGQTNLDWQKAHFLLQLIRLPLRNPCTLLRICQIAYNIGQYLKENENSPYSVDSVNYFKINNLDNLKSYILLDNRLEGFDLSQIDLIIDSINKLDTKLIYGGNYLRYKINKYQNKIMFNY
jgi:hypothetical protein